MGDGRAYGRGRFFELFHEELPKYRTPRWPPSIAFRIFFRDILPISAATVGGAGGGAGKTEFPSMGLGLASIFFSQPGGGPRRPPPPALATKKKKKTTPRGEQLGWN